MIQPIDEELIDAVMTKTPLIIVEGADDLKIYNRICSSINKKCSVLSIELLVEHQEGCKSVIEAIETLTPIIESNPHFKDYVLGIIDCDCRPFRDEVPEFENLLVLEKYSIESHFVTKEQIKYLIPHMTKIDHKIPEDSVDFIYNRIINDHDAIYYISLEALRNACDESYTGLTGYKKNPDYIFNNSVFLSDIYMTSAQ